MRTLYHLARRQYVTNILTRGFVLKRHYRGLQTFENVSDALEHCYEFATFDRVLIAFSSDEEGIQDTTCKFQRHGKALVLKKSTPRQQIQAVFVLDEAGFYLEDDVWGHTNVENKSNGKERNDG